MKKFDEQSALLLTKADGKNHNADGEEGVQIMRRGYLNALTGRAKGGREECYLTCIAGMLASDYISVNDVWKRVRPKPREEFGSFSQLPILEKGMVIV